MVAESLLLGGLRAIRKLTVVNKPTLSLTQPGLTDLILTMALKLPKPAWP
jgi:hypothetical protein